MAANLLALSKLVRAPHGCLRPTLHSCKIGHCLRPFKTLLIFVLILLKTLASHLLRQLIIQQRFDKNLPLTEAGPSHH